MTEHQLHIRNSGGALITILNDGNLAALGYGFKDLEPGVLEFTLPGDFDRTLLQIDGQIEVYRAIGAGSMMLEGDTAFFIRKVTLNTSSDGIRTISVMAYSALELMNRRIVAYYAGTSYTEKYNEHWDNMLREFVNENYGALAQDTTRDLRPWLTVQADTSWGASYFRSAPWRVVLNTLQDIVLDVRGKGIYCTFDVVSTGNGTFEYRVYLGPRGMDHSSTSANPVIVSQDRYNILEPSIVYNWIEEYNFIYATGQGEGSTRTIRTAQDDTRINISPFNRKEFNKDSRQDSLGESVQAEANSALEENRPKRTFTGKISQTEGCIYGVHWKWGDIVTAEYEGLTFDCHVDSVTVSIDGQGNEIVIGHLRSVSDV
jgi:hypothetical protein